MFDLLPSAPNELWRSDVTYIHIPGHSWWYAVTVIDYYSRYLLACHFAPSHRATGVTAALDTARGRPVAVARRRDSGRSRGGRGQLPGSAPQILTVRTHKHREQA